MRLLRVFSYLLLIALSGRGLAAERLLQFSGMSPEQFSSDFRSTVTGMGKPGDWRILQDEVPSAFPAFNSNAPVVSRRAVLAQLSEDKTDEHFPLLVYQPESFGDFKLTTQFKTIRGTAEQMAGIAFRIQDETNYYVLRASSLGNTFRFYKVVNGARGQILGPQISIPSNRWHELSVECKGTDIKCYLNGEQVIPTITDSSFSSGKIGFWTKSDSVSYFGDTRIVYTPREPPARSLVRSFCAKYSKLLDLRIFVSGGGGKTRLIACKDPAQSGESGGKAEADVIASGQIYYGKTKKSVSVTMPLRDRNGETIAAVKVVMSTFPGQTEKNAVERAAPIVRDIQTQVGSLEDLVEQ